MDEEEEKIKENFRKLSHELNRTAIRFKELSNEFESLRNKKDVDSIDLETQEKIIKLSNIMSQLVESQALLVGQLVKDGLE